MTFLNLRIAGAQVVPITADFSGGIALECADSGFIVLPLCDALIGGADPGQTEPLNRGDILLFPGKCIGHVHTSGAGDAFESFDQLAQKASGKEAMPAARARTGAVLGVVLRVQLCEIIKGGFGDSLPGHLLLTPPESRHSYIVSIAEHLAEIADNGADINKAKVTRFTELVLIEVLDLYLSLDSTTSRLLRSSSNLRIGEAVKVVHQNPEYNWTVSGLAAIAGMSRSLFASRFKETFGETPLNYVRQCRIHRAKLLLIESLAPLDQIAEQCGYASQSAFIKVFSSACGYSPGRWRSMQKNSA